MRALVTGAGGFVGQHLVGHLRERGDEVAGLDRRDGTDVLDAEAVRDAMRRHAPEVVYHLAALTHVGASWESPVATFRVNAEGTLNVLDAARAAGARRVVVVSSAEVYGRVSPEEVPIAEGSPLRPVTPYGASKAAAEHLALQAWLGAGLETVRARPFNHTGPGQSTAFLVPALAARVARAEIDGLDEVLVGSLEPERDLTDVRDVVRAYRLLAERGAPGAVYNVCSGRGVCVREVVDLLLSSASVRLAARVDPALVRPVEVPRLVGDPARLVAVTGWSPAWSLAQTVDGVLAAARDQARAADSRS